MSEVKHTLGPWVVGCGPDGVTGPTTANVSGPTVAGRTWNYAVVSCRKETIAIIPAVRSDGYGYEAAQDLDAMFANARLISAAPELLEALVLCGDSHEICKAMDDATYALVQSAIAKARGQS